MDREPDAVRVESPFARPREPRILVTLAAAFLLLALLKPWSFLDNGGTAVQSAAPDSTASGAVPAIGVLPSEATASSIPDPNAMDCLSNGTEQVVILERWPGNEVRSWVAFPEVAARGPLDNHLEAIPFFSSHVVGLGICSSSAGTDGQGAAARVLDVASIVDRGEGPVVASLGDPEPITRGVGGPDAAVLYGAPAAIVPRVPVGRPPVGRGVEPTGTPLQPRDPASATWPTGSYAIAFSFPSDGASVVRWLRIDLIHGADSSE